MSVWGSSYPPVAATHEAERRARSEDLVGEIAEGLAAAGEYVARIDPQPIQRVVDFNWAARQAGRRLGMRVHIDMKLTQTSPDGRAEVRVTPLPPPA